MTKKELLDFLDYPEAWGSIFDDALYQIQCAELTEQFGDQALAAKVGTKYGGGSEHYRCGAAYWVARYGAPASLPALKQALLDDGDSPMGRWVIQDLQLEKDVQAMSEFHLQSLESQLADRHWQVEEVKEGDDYSLSAVWVLKNKRFGERRLEIAFEGMDDLRVLPMEKSYGCHVVGHKTVSLYFSRSKMIWKKELDEFVRQLEAVMKM